MKTAILALSMFFLGAHSSFAANRCSMALAGFKWPAAGKPADMDRLSNYSKKILALGALKEKAVKTGSVEWQGNSKIRHLHVGQHDILERFSESSLSFHQERGRNPIDVTIWTFMNLGMDKGVDGLMKSRAWYALTFNSIKLLSVRDADQAKGTIGLILSAWKRIEEGTEMGVKKNPTAENVLVRASAKMISSYYQTEVSSDAIRKVFKELLPISYEQGRRVWLDSGSGGMLRSMIRFLESYGKQLEKTPQAQMDNLIFEIKGQADLLSHQLLNLPLDKGN